MAEMEYLNGAQSEMDLRIKNDRNYSLRTLDSGYKNARDNKTKEFYLYQPYADTGLSAFNQYADASGVNGQAGYDKAADNFRASPGYQWQVDQATDAVARKASSLGALGSGNTMTAITDRASNLADQEYDDYLGRLDNINKQGFAATGAQAGVLSDRANLFAQQGRDKSDVNQNFTGMSLNTKQNTTSQYLQALHGGMMAGQNAAANRWNFGMSALNGAASFIGGGGLGELKKLFA